MAYVATIGFFDGVHLGHGCLIEQVISTARKLGHKSVIVTMDQHPREVLHTDYQPSLLTTLEERSALLQGCGVDRVEVLHFDKEMSMMSAKDFMRTILHDRLQVDFLVMGYDHRFGHGGGSMAEYIRWGAECGITVIRAEKYEGMHVSSTEVRSLLGEGRVQEANRLLAHRYTLTGTVVSGHQMGRKMGFPTANLMVDRKKLIPKDGAYAVRVCADDGEYHGMLNIGVRPTLNNGKEKSLEVHLLDFAGDLYGRQLRVELLDFLREERTFASLEALRAQLEEDKREVISRLPLF